MKRLLAVLLSVAMIFVFAACNNTNEPSDENQGENNTGDTSAAELVIGGIGPVTGGAASYGTAVRNGAELAVAEINAAGGINGMQIKFLFEDDEHNPEKAVSAYNTLMDKDMQVLMGTVTSAPCTAVAAETFKDNVFQLTPSGSAVECIANPNAFRVCFSDPNQGAASAQYIKEHDIASKVAVIYDSSDIYSTGIYETFASKSAELGLEIVAAEAFSADSKTDFSVQLNKIKESGAELVFLPIYYQEASLILTQAQGILENMQYFGCDGLDGVIDQLGDNVAIAEGVMLLTPFAADAEDEKTQKFTAAYKEMFNGETPIQFAADAYDAIYIIKAAIEKAGITDASIGHSELCDALVPAMTEIEVAGVTGTMTWDASGEPTKEPKAMKIVVNEVTDEEGNTVLVGSYTAM